MPTAQIATASLPEDRLPGAMDPCLLVVLGASGDLMARLLLPALYNLQCEGRLPQRFAIVGTARQEFDTESFRERMTTAIQRFKTTDAVDAKPWESLCSRLHYIPSDADDAATFRQLAEFLEKLDAKHETAGNILFYLALAPALFAKVAEQLAAAGLSSGSKGWRRLIIEKPFGRDLDSALKLNEAILKTWQEDQLYRIDHYLGKETVQNLLAFRFANATHEPLWNREHIEHIQITAAESVGVEDRGGYYDRAGALRDMIQNHLLQLVTYVAMEPPASCRPEDIRDAKTQLLRAIRVLRPDEVPAHCVRGQYGPGRSVAGGAVPLGYCQEVNVPRDSNTETFVALRLTIDNDRWHGVPIYLRTGKRLWKRGAEIVVQFKRSLGHIFRSTPAEEQLDNNRLIFHLQPVQGIEFRFHAKKPGTAFALQRVNMRFDYRDAFAGGRGTGYEILLYGALSGDRTLFSRSDLVDASWRIVQPILDAWASQPAADFPNYPSGSWGPKAASQLLEADGARWTEIINPDVLACVPLFASISEKIKPIFLNKATMILEATQAAAGDWIVRKGDMGDAMYIIVRGDVVVDDGQGKILGELHDGGYFGELSLLHATPRAANVRAQSSCDLLVLRKADFDALLGEHPELAEQLRRAAAGYMR
jgi:glucose-6-phosphate 1-dehydrogenase